MMIRYVDKINWQESINTVLLNPGLIDSIIRLFSLKQCGSAAHKVTNIYIDAE